MGNFLSKGSLLKMLNKNKILRNFIFCLFIILIMIISTVLTYYITFSDEAFLQKEENPFSKPIEDLDEFECEEDYYSDLLGSLFWKFLTAFLAGSFLSDKLFLNLGVI